MSSYQSNSRSSASTTRVGVKVQMTQFIRSLLSLELLLYELWYQMKSPYIFKFVLSLCNQISTSTFDLRFALLVPPQSENASYAPAYKTYQWHKITFISPNNQYLYVFSTEDFKIDAGIIGQEIGMGGMYIQRIYSTSSTGNIVCVL